MPKIVDHDQRRRELVDATWRLIDRGGFASVTLQGIAAEAGFANGLVRHYFATKNDVLTAAFGRASSWTSSSTPAI